MINIYDEGRMYEVTDPVKMPLATGFLFNTKMVAQVNCRGYVTAQYMNPEPTKYSKAPNMEATTFIQPEQGYYKEHPGRFVFVKDEVTQKTFSVPYEPMCESLTSFKFKVCPHEIIWEAVKDQLLIQMTMRLPFDDTVELWEISIMNLSGEQRSISLYPYFSIGYMSWMNQSADYSSEVNGIIAKSVTPYQKYEDYKKIKQLKDMTFLIADRYPSTWDANINSFIGDRGLHDPEGVKSTTLRQMNALYETPVAVMQYKTVLAPGTTETYRFVFGPARTQDEISAYRDRYFGQDRTESENKFKEQRENYIEFLKKGKGAIKIDTPDQGFDHFINHWLPRQIYYHGVSNRLSTDPQTRNYLQDNQGMIYVDPSYTKKSLLYALGQQHISGEMPDGILLYEGAVLKYINQVPHTDHCVWVAFALKAYLDETDDYAILDQDIGFSDADTKESVLTHVKKAMDWLIRSRDERGLSYINQGDWCDPMNMVGPKGIGVSGWLTFASAYAIKIFSQICNNHHNKELAIHYLFYVDELNKSMNQFMWDGEWYARGITDDNVMFGTKKDTEGKIFLNPQSFAILSGGPDETKLKKMLNAIHSHLETPYGMEMFTPAYTSMREDVGRVTQKFPGSGENGANYNHATVFYIYALLSIGKGDEAFRILRKMIPGDDEVTMLEREQLPVFMPTYYRGAHKMFERTGGKSSRMFNTGSIAWIYRSIIEHIFGLRGSKNGLIIDPLLPSEWSEATCKRLFRGAVFEVVYKRNAVNQQRSVFVDGNKIETNCIKNIEAGKTYKVIVNLEASYDKE